MNALAPVNAGLVPTSMMEAMKLAEMMAGAKLVPQALQKSPADCLMVIQQAVRWQMDPFAVAQECSVIQGKLMHSGKLVAAVVNARGNLADRLSFAYAGDNGERTITVSGRFQGETQPRVVSVKLGDAKTSAKVWQTQPDQQLMYHGCRVWARRHCPELMLGVWSPEEFDEAPANGNGAVVIEHEEPKAKRTMAEISANKRNREAECAEIRRHLQGISSQEELDEYRATKLTLEFMQGLGNAQYAIEQMVGEREAELKVDADGVIHDEEAPAEPQTRAEYIQACHDKIDKFTDEKTLLDWWNDKESKASRRRFSLTKEEVQDLMARTMEKRKAVIAVSPSEDQAGRLEP